MNETLYGLGQNFESYGIISIGCLNGMICAGNSNFQICIHNFIKPLFLLNSDVWIQLLFLHCSFKYYLDHL